MPGEQQPQPRQHLFKALRPGGQPTGRRLDIEALGEVRVTLSAELGRHSMAVRDVLQLRKGSVISLDKLVGETADVYVNGAPFAKGEVVAIGETLYVRITAPE